LCALADIPDGGSAGFAAKVNGRVIELMAIRRGTAIFAYVNSCPHWGSPLDLYPGRFLNHRRTLIQCSTHGAQFRIEDGFCVKGPCLGASLQPVRCAVVGDEVLMGA
jgi:nitrite reductase/ring-hydroxylating ferredoxin subunit